MIRFQKRGKLNTRYIGPFCILEWIGPVAYWLELPRDLERIHDVFHVLEAPLVELRDDLSFEVQLVGIVDQRLKVLRNKVIPMVKVL